MSQLSHVLFGTNWGGKVELALEQEDVDPAFQRTHGWILNPSLESQGTESGLVAVGQTDSAAVR